MNMMQLAQMISRSPDPMRAFYQVVSQHPQGQQVINLMRGKSPEQFRGVLENMARERGTTIEQILGNMGFRINK
jgi:hypothetical protein